MLLDLDVVVEVPRHQSAVDHRHVCVLGMHSTDQSDIMDLSTPMSMSARVLWCWRAGPAPTTAPLAGLAVGRRPPADVPRTR